MPGYVGENIQSTGVAIETQGFTFVTSGKRRETLRGPATLHLYDHLGGLEALGATPHLSTEVSTSRRRHFPLLTFIDTPGLVDGSFEYPFPIEACISELARHADLVLVFFDPNMQALCNRTLEVVRALNADAPEKLRFFLSKVRRAALARAAWRAPPAPVRMCAWRTRSRPRSRSAVSGARRGVPTQRAPARHAPTVPPRLPAHAPRSLAGRDCRPCGRRRTRSDRTRTETRCSSSWLTTSPPGWGCSCASCPRCTCRSGAARWAAASPRRTPRLAAARAPSTSSRPLRPQRPAVAAPPTSPRRRLRTACRPTTSTSCAPSSRARSATRCSRRWTSSAVTRPRSSTRSASCSQVRARRARAPQRVRRRESAPHQRVHAPPRPPPWSPRAEHATVSHANRRRSVRAFAYACASMLGPMLLLLYAALRLGWLADGCAHGRARVLGDAHDVLAADVRQSLSRPSPSFRPEARAANTPSHAARRRMRASARCAC